MMNGFIKKRWLIMLLGAMAALPAMAQKQRTIIFNEDRAQHYMTSKVYELKHVGAHDIMPFIQGAIKRFDEQSTIQSLDYVKGKKQFIVVSTGSQMIPYIDDIVAKLDHPCGKTDKIGSIVDGDGVSRFVYFSKYRGTENMRSVIAQTFTGGYGSGASFFDDATNTFYWKSSKSEGEEYLKFLKAIDHPVPQMNVSLNIYLVNDNDFQELGIDYMAWKNGPGANLFAGGFDFTNFSSSTNMDQMLDVVSKGVASGMGGFMVAPQFDATFLRMLAQKGKAKMASSASLTLVNDFSSPAATSWDDASYRFKFTPQFQVIQKDEDQNTSLNTLDNSELWFYVSLPIICYSGYQADKAATLMCNWALQVNSVVEQTNMGVATVDSSEFNSTLTIAGGAEKLIATYDKDIYTKQYNGMPFLGDIPVIKYLFGSEAWVKSKAKIFVTMTATPIVPETDIPGAAGKIISVAKADLK